MPQSLNMSKYYSSAYYYIATRQISNTYRPSMMNLLDTYPE